MPAKKTAMIVDDRHDFREMCVLTLVRQGFDIKVCDNEQDALDHVILHSPHVAIVHFEMDMNRSMNLISNLNELDDTMAIIYTTIYPGTGAPVKAMNSGAYSVIRRDIPQFANELTSQVNSAYEESVRRKQKSPLNSEVFVLMPFDKGFDPIYHLAIKEPLKGLGFSCQRADEVPITGNIMNEIYRRIQAAQLIVADMTGQNPNVFYEVGYAHALGKTVILVTQNVADLIPFDLRAQKHIIYGGDIMKLRVELIKVVEAIGRA